MGLGETVLVFKVYCTVIIINWLDILELKTKVESWLAKWEYLRLDKRALKTIGSLFAIPGERFRSTLVSGSGCKKIQFNYKCNFRYVKLFRRFVN